MRYIWPKYPFGRFGHVPGLLEYLAANEEATGGEKGFIAYFFWFHIYSLESDLICPPVSWPMIYDKYARTFNGQKS